MKITKEIEELKDLYHRFKIAMLEVEGLDCQGNRDNAYVHLKPKRLYTYVDYGQRDGQYHSGKWLIDLNDMVWSIKAYGQRNRVIGSVSEVISNLKEDLEAIEQAKVRKAETGSFGMLSVNYC